MKPSKSGEPLRRQFLKRAGAASGAAVIGPLMLGSSSHATGEPAGSPPPRPIAPASGYESVGPEEAVLLERIVDLLCPEDALTPGGVEIGLAIYIDRQLAGAFGRGDRLYRHGPWHAGKIQLGYQSPLTPERYFKTGLAALQSASKRSYGKPFVQLSASDADSLLQGISDGKVSEEGISLTYWFNEMLYPLFAQACFADPMYGGNRDKVFWKLVGYPGLPAFNTRNVVEFRGKEFPAARQPRSIQDFS